MSTMFGSLLRRRAIDRPGPGETGADGDASVLFIRRISDAGRSVTFACRSAGSDAPLTAMLEEACRLPGATRSSPAAASERVERLCSASARVEGSRVGFTRRAHLIRVKRSRLIGP